MTSATTLNSIKTTLISPKHRSGFTTLAKASIVNKPTKPLANILSNHLFYYPTPANLSSNWSFGSPTSLSVILAGRPPTPEEAAFGLLICLCGVVFVFSTEFFCNRYYARLRIEELAIKEAERIAKELEKQRQLDDRKALDLIKQKALDIAAAAFEKKQAEDALFYWWTDFGLYGSSALLVLLGIYSWYSLRYPPVIDPLAALKVELALAYNKRMVSENLNFLAEQSETMTAKDKKALRKTREIDCANFLILANKLGRLGVRF